MEMAGAKAQTCIRNLALAEDSTHEENENF
jgi:hypothetical protein